VIWDFIFIATFFFVEMLHILNQNALAMIFLRRGDHSAAADAGEARFRSLPAEAFPAVDVFIPTYNEPLEVLERTILCAKAMDWPNLNVWVLDDGRRDWLRQWSERHQVGYLTRPDNKGAKAGNINHALSVTSAPFILVLDADFVPQRNMLRRCMGIFDDPKVGIVQTPHAFFNPDPLQHNLYGTSFIPNEQRFFFDVIQPARDGWNASFCCGSNGIIRRAALDRIGGRLPTESITEDLLLTLRLLRCGFVTRYLNENLAWGLAPESLNAFIIQRSRWGRGAIQTLFLKDGPLGPGLTITQRILFLANPLYWLSFTTMHVMAILGPIVFMFTGYLPIANVSWEDVVFYQIPVMVYFMVFGAMFGGGKIHPVLSNVANTFMAVRLTPAIISAFVKPFGEGFRVTPKGSAARVGTGDRTVRRIALAFMLLTITGLMMNAEPDTRIIETPGLIPVTVAWSVWNILVLSLVMAVAEGVPVRRQNDRFDMGREPVAIIHDSRRFFACLKDMSEGGVLLDTPETLPSGARAIIAMKDVPPVAIEILHRRPNGLPARFVDLSEDARQGIIAKLFSGECRPVVAAETRGAVTFRLLAQAVRKPDTA
jgi:cellulose synthase (UDP-forming)